MDAHELARWTRFAAKGGIGKCTAVVDCIAQEMGEDLMFLKARHRVRLGEGWSLGTDGGLCCRTTRSRC